jgi:hypothetical protein
MEAVRSSVGKHLPDHTLQKTVLFIVTAVRTFKSHITRLVNIFSFLRLLSVISKSTSRHKQYSCMCVSIPIAQQMKHASGNFMSHTIRRIYCAYVGSIPDEVIGFFNLPNPSSRTMALGSTQPLIEISTRNLPGGKGRPARGADNLTATCEPIF